MKLFAKFRRILKAHEMFAYFAKSHTHYSNGYPGVGGVRLQLCCDVDSYFPFSVRFLLVWF